MLNALGLSARQLADPAIIRILAKSLLITLLLTAALAALATFGISALFNWWVNNKVEDGSYYALADGLAGAIVAFLIFIFGFRIIAIPVISFFGDEIVAAVEARHFPAAALTAGRVSIAMGIRMGLASLVRLLLFNLLALPFYIALAVTGIGAIALFVAVNAVLLGRDLGEMVAVRHLDARARAAWLRATRGSRFVMGLIVTGLFMIPLLNLLAPVMGAGMATHLFHRRQS